MKKAYIVVIVVIIIIAAAIGSIAFKQPDLISKFAPLKSFTQSSGAFSFKYPPNLLVAEQNGVVMIAPTATGSRPVASFAVLAFPGYFSEIKKNPGANFEEMTSNGLPAYAIRDRNHPEYGVVYAVQLDEGADASEFIVGGMVSNSNGFSQDDLKAIFKTLTIDKEKARALAKKNLETARAKALDARQMANLSQLRVSAELYWDSIKSYDNLCNPSPGSPTGKSLQELFKTVTDSVGAANLACLATKEAYSISIRLPSGKNWCADSKGEFVEVPTLAKRLSCK